MHWTQGLSRVKSTALRSLILACLLVLTIIPDASARSSAWPDGWSREHSVGTAEVAYGHRTVSWDNDSLWVASVSPSASGLTLDLRLMSIEGTRPTTHVVLPIQYLLKGYTLAPSGDGLLVAWIERNEGVQSQLWMAEITEAGIVASRRVLWESPALAESPDLVVDEAGKAHLVFTSTVEGQHSVYLLSFFPSSDLLAEPVRLTPPTQMDTLPVVAVHNGKLHLVYYGHTLQHSFAVYCLYELEGVRLLATNVLNHVPEYHPHPPALFPEADSRVRVVWQRMSTGSGNKVVPGPAVQGTLDAGKWQQPLKPVLASHGRIAAVRASRGRDGRLLISWLTQSGSTWQTFAVFSDGSGDKVSAGLATLTSGNVLDPRPLVVGNHGVLTYFRRVPSGGSELFLVHTASPAKRPLSHRIGLDHNAPVSDLLYKYLTLMTGSAAMAFVALGALLVSLLVVAGLSRIGLFSSSPLGCHLRLALQFAILAILKRPDTLIYYQAQIIPGWGAVVSWISAAACTLAVLHMSEQPLDDYITLAFAGVIFMLADTFTSLYVLGVGRW